MLLHLKCGYTAQQGDAEAQVTVGEIYEKGLGGVADPNARCPSGI